MTVTPEQIMELEKIAENDESAMHIMMTELITNQPALFEWVTHKFNIMTKPSALLGACMFSLILLKKDKGPK